MKQLCAINFSIQKLSKMGKYIGLLAVLALVLFFDMGCEKSLEELDSENYNICGKYCLNRTVERQSFLKTWWVEDPFIIIYLLQDKNERNRLKISVSQEDGYSISEIIINSDVLDDPMKIEGEGKYWGDKVTLPLVCDAAYEKEIVVTSAELNPQLTFRVEVTYWWICDIDMLWKL